jgi:hypothetical protein
MFVALLTIESVTGYVSDIVNSDIIVVGIDDIIDAVTVYVTDCVC